MTAAMGSGAASWAKEGNAGMRRIIALQPSMESSREQLRASEYCITVDKLGSCIARETKEKSVVEKFAMHSVEAMRQNKRETTALGCWRRLESSLMNSCEESTTFGSRIVIVAGSQTTSRERTRRSKLVFRYLLSKLMLYHRTTRVTTVVSKDLEFVVMNDYIERHERR
jgi:hypothetical protein